jgi:hypothetical protein
MTVCTVTENDIGDQLPDGLLGPTDEMLVQLQPVTAAAAKMAASCDTPAILAFLKAASTPELLNTQELVAQQKPRLTDDVLSDLLTGYFQLLSSVLDAARALMGGTEFGVDRFEAVDECRMRIQACSEGMLVIQFWLGRLTGGYAQVPSDTEAYAVQ